MQSNEEIIKKAEREHEKNCESPWHSIPSCEEDIENRIVQKARQEGRFEGLAESLNTLGEVLRKTDLTDIEKEIGVKTKNKIEEKLKSAGKGRGGKECVSKKDLKEEEKDAKKDSGKNGSGGEASQIHNECINGNCGYVWYSKEEEERCPKCNTYQKKKELKSDD
ncbi:MAG: hypothetical protein V3U92_19730 [Cellulophaga sp.]